MAAPDGWRSACHRLGEVRATRTEAGEVHTEIDEWSQISARDPAVERRCCGRVGSIPSRSRSRARSRRSYQTGPARELFSLSSASERHLRELGLATVVEEAGGWRRESQMDPITAVAAWVFALFGIAVVVFVARQGGSLHQGEREDDDAQHLRGSWR